MKTTAFCFDQTDNLIRIFLLPTTVSAEFCSPVAPTVEFILVDWFRPSPGVNDPWDIEVIRDFVRKKIYYRPTRNYLAMCRTGECFLIDPPKKPAEG